MKHRRRSRWRPGPTLGLLTLLATACGGETPDPNPLGADGGSSVDAGSPPDTGPDPARDAGPSPMRDAGPQPAPDAGPDTTPDAGPEPPPDAGPRGRPSGFGVGGGGGAAASARYRAAVVVSSPAGVAESTLYRVEIGPPLGR